jgi:glutathione peroxidase
MKKRLTIEMLGAIVQTNCEFVQNKIRSFQVLSMVRRCLAFLGLLAAGAVPSAAAAAGCPALLDHSFPGLIDGKPVSLCQYAGKVILVVNTASYCGFTSQYDGLEKLYERLGGKGLVVLGFPSNDFGEQEPGSDREIADFCRLTYGVQFPMLGKTSVRGRDANSFYVRLAQVTGSTPKWNFHKYLINRDATRVVAYTSFTKPDDRDLLKTIDEFLAR